MRVLLIETAMSGHHLPYLRALMDCSNDVAVVTPIIDDAIKAADNKVYAIPFSESKTIWRYIKWLRQVKKIVDSTDPDVIHLVYGDSIYKFMGIGLRYMRRKHKCIVTCHQIRHSRLRDIGIKMLARSVNAVVVHTSELTKELQALGINNVFHVEYPHFGDECIQSCEYARGKLGIALDDDPVLLALGGTRYDKGLDMLLESLKDVNIPFHLLIAGKPEFFTEDYINEHVSNYSKKVTCLLRLLSNEEFSLCLSAADVVVLPYRKSFNGASGPLSDGVWHKKMIIGPDHGSLGKLIADHHLGATFEAENIDSLRDCILKQLLKKWEPDDIYRQYRDVMSTGYFQDSYRDIYYQMSHLEENKKVICKKEN